MNITTGIGILSTIGIITIVAILVVTACRGFCKHQDCCMKRFIGKPCSKKK